MFLAQNIEYLFLGFMVSEKSDVILNFAPKIFFFLLASFRISLCLGSCSLNMIGLRLDFLVLSCVVLSELPESMVWGNPQPLLLQTFLLLLPLFLLLMFPLCTCYTFDNCLIAVEDSVFPLLHHPYSLFSLLFSL